LRAGAQAEAQINVETPQRCYTHFLMLGSCANPAPATKIKQTNTIT